MNGHLSDEQWAGVLAGEADAETQEHLSSCAECAAGQEKAAGAIAGWATSLRTAGQREDAFWRDQRRAIAAHWEARPVSRPRRAAWAAALAGLALLAVSLARQEPPVHEVAKVDADHALLVDVERSMRREVPVALEPATLLAAEMHRAAEAQQKP